jgi:hypothetical protein
MVRVRLEARGGREGGRAYLSWLQHGLQVRDVHLNESHEPEGQAEAGKEGVAVQVSKEGGRKGEDERVVGSTTT